MSTATAAAHTKIPSIDPHLLSCDRATAFPVAPSSPLSPGLRQPSHRCATTIGCPTPPVTMCDHIVSRRGGGHRWVPGPRPMRRPHLRRYRTMATTSPCSSGPTTSWMAMTRSYRVMGRRVGLAAPAATSPLPTSPPPRLIPPCSGTLLCRAGRPAGRYGTPVSCSQPEAVSPWTCVPPSHTSVPPCPTSRSSPESPTRVSLPLSP